MKKNTFNDKKDSPKNLDKAKKKKFMIDILIKTVDFCLHEEEVCDKNGENTGRLKLRDSAYGLKAIEILGKLLGFFSKESDTIDTPALKIINNLDENKI